MSPSRPKIDKTTGMPVETIDPNVVTSRAGYFTKQYESSPLGSRTNSPGMSSRAMSPAASIMSPRPKKAKKKKKDAVDLAKVYREEVHKAFSHVLNFLCAPLKDQNELTLDVDCMSDHSELGVFRFIEKCPQIPTITLFSSLTKMKDV